MSSVSRGARVRDDGYGGLYRGRKVLVTGGLGFIGLNLSQRLLDLGADVTILDNLVSSELTGLLSERRGSIEDARG